jgi:uncharacterized protein YdhG (YjbR/CyaY superfamily)
MDKKKNQISTVDEYIWSFQKDVGKLLRTMRSAIRKAAPKAVEKISWQMPAYSQNGMLVFFAGHKNHIGFYALPNAIKAYKNDLRGYYVSKGTIRFPLDKKLPVGLIKKMVKFRVKENEMKRKLKK